jgi:hypothetical protein
MLKVPACERIQGLSTVLVNLAQGLFILLGKLQETNPVRSQKRLFLRGVLICKKCRGQQVQRQNEARRTNTWS